VLVLTKPLGFGVIATALKRDQADEKDVKEVVSWMTRLNKTAGALAVEFNLRGGTDVTGFSLLGHGWEMAEAAGVALEFEFTGVPFVSNARKYAELGAFAGGLVDNRAYFGPHIQFGNGIDLVSQMMLFDPQTSGGLLLGVPPAKLDDFTARAKALDQPVWITGEAKHGAAIPA